MPYLCGGGGGIRTHEGLRPAGFQDRSHQPLDHPSLGKARLFLAQIPGSSKIVRQRRDRVHEARQERGKHTSRITHLESRTRHCL